MTTIATNFVKDAAVTDAHIVFTTLEHGRLYIDRKRQHTELARQVAQIHWQTATAIRRKISTDAIKPTSAKLYIIKDSALEERLAFFTYLLDGKGQSFIIPERHLNEFGIWVAHKFGTDAVSTLFT